MQARVSDEELESGDSYCSESQIDLFLILVIFLSLTYESKAKK